MNAGHVVRTAGGASAFEGPPRRWKAFGGLRTGSSALERGYASQGQEGASGLVLMGARHYDPATGRFLQPDPLGIDAGELYAYAASNPYGYWDPTGLMIQSFAADAWSGVSGFLDRQLGFGEGLAVAGAGAAGAVGAGYAIGAGAAAIGCAAVCIPALGVVGVGAIGYDLYNGGASRIADSFRSVWNGDATVGQALEVGAITSGVASLASAAVRSLGPLGAREAAVAEGGFSIVDWAGYPRGIPRPGGPFRLVEGAEYDAARDAANLANNALRRQQGLVGQPVDIHEVQPIKFGGSPVDPANKIVVPRDLHRQEITPWWNQLLRDIGG
jgi:RHS repeat-associated protein